MRPLLRKIFVASWLVAVFCCVAGIFWHTELVYSKPTPIPEQFTAVSEGSVIQLALENGLHSRKPRLIHFFNPDCPCSRFNVQHLQSLVNKYGEQVDFSVVVLTDKTYSEAEIRDRFDFTVPISFDASIADRCGVISTPQAVILDSDARLFYRGNYNKSRYCTDVKSDYARIAIDSLLAGESTIGMNPLAKVAYGCALPSAGICKKPGS